MINILKTLETSICVKPKEAAALLQLPLHIVLHLIKSRALPSIRTSNRIVLITMQDINKLLAYPNILKQLKLLKVKRRKFVGIKDRKLLFNRDNGLCGICNQQVKFEEMHIDHIKPVCYGGTDELHNLQISHSKCNSVKVGKYEN